MEDTRYLTAMLSVLETRDLILSHAPVLETESVSLPDAHGRVLRETVCADADSPPFDCSAMDGYAIRAGDDSDHFRLVGEVQAGSDNIPEIATGECVRIFTGAKVPSSAGKVIMQEQAILENGLVRFEDAGPQSHIRKQGENGKRGDVMLSSGCRLEALELAILANCGVVMPTISRRLRFAHLVTGNEIVPPETTPSGTQIRDSNSILIRSLLHRHGATLVDQQRVGDDPVALRETAGSLPDHDIILISGGASVGAYDFTLPLLKEAGFEIHLQKVNLRPGKPLIFATRGKQLAFGLPGNPVSHWVVFSLFIAPLIAHMIGAPATPRFHTGKLATEHQFRPDNRHTFWPCRAEPGPGGYLLTPLRFVSSGDILCMAGANALLSLPSGENDIAANGLVEFILCES